MAGQDDLILQQFSAARQRLGQQQKAQSQQAEQDINRRTAMTAMTGGAATKSLQKSQQNIADSFGQSEAALSAEQAKALQGVQAEKEARQYQTSERLGTQEFGAGEAEKQRAEAARQFNANYGLQNAQFQAAQDQFNKQLQFTYSEFNENQKANLLNSFIAMDQAGLSSDDIWRSINDYKEIMQKSNLTRGDLLYKPTSPVMAAPDITQYGADGVVRYPRTTPGLVGGTL